MVSLSCGRCGRMLEFSGERPSFCAYCGQPLSSIGMEVTVDHVSDPSLNPTGNFLFGNSGRVDALPGRIDRYSVIRKIGEGGIGTVFEAEDETENRRVAIKILNSRFDPSPESFERFRQEGRLASTISHPRCVFVIAADEYQGQPYIVMELMTGLTLQSLVEQEGPLPVGAAVARILDVVEGLIEAHRLGVIHRDVKPSNCFLEAEGRVKVGDFGLSKSLTNQSHLTRTGAFVGTPLYASPEQIKGESLDVRTDVYSVAATSYFLLAGKPPFEAPDAAATLARIVTESPIPPREWNPDIPPPLESAILRGMDRDRDRRWRDLEEFREVLLPFAPVSLPSAEIGSRVGAFLVDLAIIFILQTLFRVGLMVVGVGVASQWHGLPNPVFSILLPLLIWILYFGPDEGIWGSTLGKRLFRLRVQSSRANRPPGVARAVLRVLILFLILVLPCVLGLGLLEQSWGDWRSGAFIGSYILLGMLLFATSCLITLSTMNERNGLSGPHELLSGTRVVRSPRRTWRTEGLGRRALGRDRGASRRPIGVLEQVGPYKIRGAVRWEQDRRVLSAQDTVLGREVWVVLRPRDAESPSQTRRELARATRPRWLAGGNQTEGRWDAYVAPSGCSLSDLAGPDGISWEEVKPVLMELATELEAACHDGTLPEGLNPEQIWIEPDGRLQLVDPLGQGPASECTDAKRALNTHKAIALFASVAALALEGGRRRLGDSTTRVRAAVPAHARRFLDRLIGARPQFDSIEELVQALRELESQPTKLGPVTRALRLLGFIASIPVRLALTIGLLVILNLMGLTKWIGPDTGVVSSLGTALTVALPLWTVVAGFTQGRFLCSLLGGVLVDRDGFPPRWWRCMFREFVVWAPCVLLTQLSAQILSAVPGLRTNLFAFLGLLLLPMLWILIDAGAELLDPGRTLHDRASGTRLVPR